MMINKISNSLSERREKLEKELDDIYFFDEEEESPKIEIAKSGKKEEIDDSVKTVTIDELVEDLLTPEEITSLRDYNESMYRTVRSITNINRRRPQRVTGASAQELEFLKCKYDIVYFLENYCIITAAGANIRMLLNDKLRIIARLYEASVPHIFMTSRQSSKTTIELVCIAWYFNFWNNTGTIMINITQGDNKKNIKFVKDTIGNLPDFLRVWNPKVNRDDVDNVHEIATPESSNSKMSGIVIDKSDPGDTGRGKTGSPYWDEAAYLKGIRDAFAAVQFTYNTYSRFAKMAYVPAPLSITSTPNDLGSESGAFFNAIWNQGFELDNSAYKDMENKLPDEIYQMYVEVGTPYLRVFQRWYEFPGRISNPWLVDESNPDNIRSVLDDNTVSPATVAEYDTTAAEWLRDSYNVALNDRRTIKKDIFCEFFNSGEHAIFDEEIADEIMKQRTAPVGKIDIIFDGDTLNKRATLNIYKKVDFDSINTIISVDPAESAQGDNLAISVINDANGEVLADLHTKTGKIRAISDIVFKVHQFLPNSPVIIERNNFGKAVIERIEEKKEFKTLYSRLFYYYDVDKSGRPKTDVKIYGINTGKDNREQMFTLLMEQVQSRPELLNSSQLIKELVALEYKNGKVQASPGSTDDNVMSYNLALYVREYKRRDLTRLFFDRNKISSTFRSLSIANDMRSYSVEELDTVLDTVVGPEDEEAGDKILGEFRKITSAIPQSAVDFFTRFN